ncbi:MAG: thermonuclease family protein [Verrucomicrobiae bacterium]|nr:thermonuclease family protein [Verrucomicrobiae bacterium]
MPTPQPPSQNLYHYRAIVTDVYDGDTCTADIDLGLNTWIHGEKLRLHRINAPELTGRTRARGVAARDHLRKLILNQTVVIQTIKDRREKYGRYLAEIWLEQNGRWTNVNDAMIASGHVQRTRY